MQAVPHESTTDTTTSQNSTAAVDEHTALPPPPSTLTTTTITSNAPEPQTQTQRQGTAAAAVRRTTTAGAAAQEVYGQADEEANNNNNYHNNNNDNGLASLAMLSRAQLEERLRVSDEWNVRLQRQLQELLQLPQSDMTELRERMQSPDIAIPLLQCYDATIAEKTEEVLRLERENAALRTRLESTSNEREGIAQAAQVAEKLASSVEEKTAQQLRRGEAALRETEAELRRVRQELTRALNAEAERKLAAERAEEACATLRDELARANEAKQKALQLVQQQQQQQQPSQQQSTRPANSHTVGDEPGLGYGAASHVDASALLTTMLSPHSAALQANSITNTNSNGTEAMRVQLALLARENEDKAQELERLRGRMLQALRQSADNHAAHLRVVEERHKLVVEELRSVGKTQELEVFKLRAQLARLDPGSPTSQHQWELQLRRTGELLAEQARQGLESELQRCNEELATVQRERDGRVAEYEQMLARTQRAHEEEVGELRQALQQVQKKLEKEKAQHGAQAEEAARQAQQLTSLREKLRRTTQELQEARSEAGRSAQALHELTEKHAEATSALERQERAAQQAMSAERQRNDDLGERVRLSLNELQEMKDKAREEQAARERECAQLRRQLQSEQQRGQSLEAARAELERGKQTLEIQLGKLNEALGLHKRQLASCDAQVHQLQSQLELAWQERRAQMLSEERLKVENARLVRARDRLTGSLQARYY